nr:retrovirus-related Pol polyprotein from transposon TNT 1-94 [Tanacetum cinerariifolium]
MSIDDLYNNFKIVEQEVKVTASSNSSSQNMDFVSSPSTNSTNEVQTAYGVTTASTQSSTAITQVSISSSQTSTANLSDAIVYAFLANQSNVSQLVHEDLEQIHEDDLEEMDLKWQLALLSMRAKRGPRNQDSRNKYQDSSRRTVHVEETPTKAMVAIDGVGFDWSYMAEDEVSTNMALMAFLDSEGTPQDALKINDIFDSGCSRHMTGNISYLSDFKEHDRGYVTFREGAKGGKITGKGTIRTDQLGKFNEKLDERIFVGYSTTGKAFRVYSIRSRKVEENLHITFLKNKPIIVGGGSEWLFNINALSKSLNYALVSLGTNSNDFASKGAIFDTASESNNQERPNAESSTKTVNIVGPVNTATPTYADYPNDPFMPDLEDAGSFMMLMMIEMKVLSTKTINIVGPVNTATPTYADYPNDPFMPDLEDAGSFMMLMMIEMKKQERSERVVVRNKARLVAQGHRQEEGIDYDEVFAPVAWIEAIRLFLAYASLMNFIVYQMDVKSESLYGTIEEEVYVSQPPGFVNPKFPDRVHKVEKVLYGLHQALKACYETLSTYLLDNGFRRWTIDKTLFIKKIKYDILLVQVYVDEIIFSSTKRSLSTEFEQLMHKRFQISSMDELTFFLRLQVEQRKDGIFLSQDKYVCDILKKFGFSSVKSSSTLMETHKPLSKDAAGIDVDVHLYRFQVQPKVSHMHAVKRIFRYLKGQPTLGLWYPKELPLELIAYFDNDYVSANLDRKSSIGGLKLKGYLINDGHANLVQHAGD